MQSAVLGLFGVGMAAALAELLLTEDEGRGIKTVLRLLTSLAILLLLVRPFLGVLQTDLSAAFEDLAGESEADIDARYEDVFLKAVEAGSEVELRAGLYQLLESEYGIGEEEADIVILFSEDAEIEKVKITLSGRGLLQDPDALAEDLATRLNCETEVR